MPDVSIADVSITATVSLCHFSWPMCSGRLAGMVKAATPAINQLTAAAVAHSLHEFDHQPNVRGFGLQAAAALGGEPERVFKTLMTLVDDQVVVGIVPVTAQLSLRHLAGALGAKRAEMCPIDVAERATGYVVGGISPFGQKRASPTVIDETCQLFDTILVSGGQRGLEIEIAPGDLIAVLSATVADIAVRR